MNNPRHELAAARIVLRAAEDGEATLKAIISGQAVGSNDTQRKASTAELLLHNDDYQDALRELRTAQAAVDHAQAAVDVANDELRRAELAARERLAEALMGRRTDDAVGDRAIAIVQRLARISADHSTVNDYYLAEIDGVIGSANDLIGSAQPF